MKSLVLACVTAVAILGGNAEVVARPEKWAVPMTCAGAPNLHKVSDKLYRSAQYRILREGWTVGDAAPAMSVLTMRSCR